jgi:plastocyanin
VTVGYEFYSPTRLTIKKGATIKWAWQRGGTSDSHTVTDLHGRWSSRQMTSGSYSHRFTRSGSFVIFCKMHPDPMRIRVTVRR